jgi:hypothetical protein
VSGSREASHIMQKPFHRNFAFGSQKTKTKIID